MIRAQNSSVPSSTPSATPASDVAFRRAIAEALEELRAARKLIEAQGLELKVKDELIALEKQIAEGLKNLRSLDAKQLEQLNLALAAKDRVIAAYEAEIVVLKKNQWTLGKAVKYMIYRAAAGIIVGTVLRN